MFRELIVLTIAVALLVSGHLDRSDCNEAVCASIVSKCMLTEACKCDNIRTNKTCSYECETCLDYLYQDCCLCLDLCERSEDDINDINLRSNVEYIKDPQSDLFNLLTELPDHLERWKSYSYEVRLVNFVDDSESGDSSSGDTNVNCTVAFMSQCMSLNKCKSSCTSMGASAYRWFHDGCCQCVDQYCPDFGLSQSKCTHCPLETPSTEHFPATDNTADDPEPINQVSTMLSLSS